MSLPSSDITKSTTKITKVPLVIYCSVMLLLCVICILISIALSNYSFLWGYFLCLGPSIIFVLVSIFLPMNKLIISKAKKGEIAVIVIAYIIKYLLIIFIPLIGVKFNQKFNNWTMLTTTLIAPIVIIISKVIFANYVSKNDKKNNK